MYVREPREAARLCEAFLEHLVTRAQRSERLRRRRRSFANSGVQAKRVGLTRVRLTRGSGAMESRKVLVAKDTESEKEEQ